MTKPLVILSLGVLLVGCAGLASDVRENYEVTPRLLPPGVHTDYEFDHATRFEGLRSFEFLNLPDAAPRDERIDAKLLAARVQRAVSENLEQRGFVRDTHGTPDFLVAHHAMLDARFEIDSYIDLNVYGYRPWAQPLRTQSVTRDYDEGVLILDVISAKTRTLIWRGYGETRVDLDDYEARKSADTIRELVGAMLAAFPPRQAPRSAPR